MHDDLTNAMTRFKTEADWLRAFDSINTWSSGGNHRQADMLLLGYLRAHGHGAIADAWEKASKHGQFHY